MSTKMWSVNIDGAQNVITLERVKPRKIFITINGMQMEIPLSNNPRGGLWSATGADSIFSFQIGAHQLFIAVRQGVFTKDFSLYCDSQNVETGAPYTQPAPMPAWNWIFIVLMIVSIIVNFGWLSLVFGLIMIVATVSVSRNEKYTVLTRVLMCIGIVALYWILLIVLVTMLMILFPSAYFN